MFSGLGGTLTLSAGGELYGAGWNLSLPYGPHYDAEAAKGAAPVRIAGGVISAAAGFNYGLYVTQDGALHFIGDSGLPFAERFAFEGRVREVWAAPDRDEFRLTDERGETWVWGNNLSGRLQPPKITPRAVLDDQTLIQRRGFAILAYRLNGEERRHRGALLQHPDWAVRAELRRRASESEVYRRLSAEYGEDNILLKYVKRAQSPERESRSPNWSEEDFERVEGGDGYFYPRGPGVEARRVDAWHGTETELRYSIAVYTNNNYLFRPVKAVKET